MKAHYHKDLIVDEKLIKHWKISVCGSPEGIEITMFTDEMFKNSPRTAERIKKWTIHSIRNYCVLTDNLSQRKINREVCRCILYNNKVNYQKRFEICY